MKEFLIEKNIDTMKLEENVCNSELPSWLEKNQKVETPLGEIVYIVWLFKRELDSSEMFSFGRMLGRCEK